MCHDPRTQTNFDQVASAHPTSAPARFDAMSFGRAILTEDVCVQKGHAIGGSTITILSCKYSRGATTAATLRTARGAPCARS